MYALYETTYGMAFERKRRSFENTTIAKNRMDTETGPCSCYCIILRVIILLRTRKRRNADEEGSSQNGIVYLSTMGLRW